MSDWLGQLALLSGFVLWCHGKGERNMTACWHFHCFCLLITLITGIKQINEYQKWTVVTNMFQALCPQCYWETLFGDECLKLCTCVKARSKLLDQKRHTLTQ